MRNLNLIPILTSDGYVQFVDNFLGDDMLMESEIKIGPAYYYQQYVEKYM